MSFSSSKSTSRNPNSTTTTKTKTATKLNVEQPGNPTRKPGPRRSRSVSAYSRTQLDITSGFDNTRVNPLFWADGSDCFDQFEAVSSNFDHLSVINVVESRSGRSITRNSGGGGGGGERGRSFSTVDTARRRQRSPSRGSHSRNYEGERKQESSSNLRSSSKTGLTRNQTLRDGKTKMVRSASDLSEILKGSNTWSSQHPAFETSDDSTISLSDRDQEIGMLSNSRRNNRIGSNSNQSCKLVKSSFDLSEEPKGSNTWSSQHPVFVAKDYPTVSLTPYCNDETLTRPGISEIEERTLKPVSEERKVINNNWEDNNGTEGVILETVRTEVRRAFSDMHKDLKDAMLRSDSDIISDSMFSDVALELANPDTLELVNDFREEFTRELEECEERARKLRAELAIEEHRELELSQILNDMIPEPETPEVLKPRLTGKGSFERRTMTKRLEEEAMAYFDECVSISTFDESDFSSLEDPPSHKARVGETADVPGGAYEKSIGGSFESQDIIRQSSHMHSDDAPNLSTSGMSNDSSRRPQFSFTSKHSDSLTQKLGVQNYVKLLSKDKEQETNKSSVLRAVPRKLEIYNSETPVEKYLLDKMTFRSRIESGGMLLCGGGVGFCSAPFSSNFR